MPRRSPPAFGDDPLVHEAIAWGVMNRVRLAERSESMKKSYGSGIRGVVFKKGQFNPAVSPRSPFSRDFLCPKERAIWRLALEAAGKAMAGEKNPFIQTPWEQEHNLSLVVNFYYPKSDPGQGALSSLGGRRGPRVHRRRDDRRQNAARRAHPLLPPRPPACGSEVRSNGMME